MERGWTVVHKADDGQGERWRQDAMFDFYDAHPNAPSGSGFGENVLITTVEDDEETKLRREMTRSTPPSSATDSPTEEDDEKDTFLLSRITCNGFRFNLNHPDLEPKNIEIAKGSILRPVGPMDDTDIIGYLKNVSVRDCTKVRDCADASVYALMHRHDTMRVTKKIAKLLLPLAPADRLNLYDDLERFLFVRSLKPGANVLVFLNQTMYNGVVVREGDRPLFDGTYFYVDVKGSRGGFDSGSVEAVSAGQIYPPPRSMNSTASSYRSNGEMRVIPVKVVDNRDAPPYETRNGAVETRNGAADMRYAETRNGSADFRYGAAETRNGRSYGADERKAPPPTLPRTRFGKECEPEAKATANRVRDVPIKRVTNQTNDEVSLVGNRHVAVEWERDPAATMGWQIGDRCVWPDKGKEHHATIRFLGYLRDHNNMYAGLEFDEPIGQGTGMYQGSEPFRTEPGYAGYVILQHVRHPPDPFPPSTSSSFPPSSVLSGTTVSAMVRPLSPTRIHRKLPPAPPPRPAASFHDEPSKNTTAFQTGSYVEVCHDGLVRCGVVKWIGEVYWRDLDRRMMSAIVDLDSDVPLGWHSSSEWPEVPIDFTTNTVMVPLTDLHQDRSTRDMSNDNGFGYCDNNDVHDFGSIDSGVEFSRSEPWKSTDELLGRMKGIQGHRNSCYLDATLYALFVQSTAFDQSVLREPNNGDQPDVVQLINVLKQEIVWPLRRFHYVRADHVMKVRKLLEKLIPQVKGLTSDEKDPEEVLSVLFKDLLKTNAFVQLVNTKDGSTEATWLYHVVVDSEWQGGVTTTQHLLEKSLKKDLLKFAHCPQVLILILPRYGTQKIFDKIVPLEKMDVTWCINNASLPCANCNKVAECMCPECYLLNDALYSKVSYCIGCFRSVHMSMGMMDHVERPLAPGPKPSKKSTIYKMSLSSVLCIETSHYVSFVRSLAGKWLFFDSMADRQGLSDGFNIPQVRLCERMSESLSLSTWDRLRSGDALSSAPFGQNLDSQAMRLLSDCYLCVYTADPPIHPPSVNFMKTLANKVMEKV